MPEKIDDRTETADFRHGGPFAEHCIDSSCVPDILDYSSEHSPYVSAMTVPPDTYLEKLPHIWIA